MNRGWPASAIALLLFLGAAQAQEKPTARPQVGQPVKQAEQLLKERKYPEALVKLADADAVPDKTAYERYVIDATRAAIDLGSGDAAAAINALRAVLATGILSPRDALLRRQVMVQLDDQVKDYPQVIADAERYYQQGGTSEEPRLLTAQAYYLESDFAAAARVIRAILQTDDKAAKNPDENLLLMLLNCDYQQKDEAGRIDTLERLVALNPKPQYWTEVLAAVAREPGFADGLALDLDRLKVATGAMIKADDYLEAAQRALLAGLPGDAQTLLRKGEAAGVFVSGAASEREQRLAAMAAHQGSDDQKGLVRQVNEAGTAANGLAAEKLGEVYASYRRYDEAIAAYQLALQKGGLQFPEHARLHLGIAELAAGQKAQARATIGAITDVGGTRDLARLWLIEGGA